MSNLKENILTPALDAQAANKKLKAALNEISYELATYCPAYSERLTSLKLSQIATDQIATDQIAEELTDLIIQFAEKLKAALNEISYELATHCPAYSERLTSLKLSQIAADQIAEELTDLIIQFAEDRLDEVGEAITEQLSRWHVES